jgi:putative FmdB family regulatory protein
MPLYEYACKKCGHRFEEIRKFSDKHLSKCPECGGVLEQVISAPAVRFKGSGWYVTDYAKKGSSSASSSSSSSENESSAKEAKEKKDGKDTRKDEKPKSETSPKKQKKD